MRFQQLANGDRFVEAKDQDGSAKVFEKVDGSTAVCINVTGQYARRLIGGKFKFSPNTRVWRQNDEIHTTA